MLLNRGDILEERYLEHYGRLGMKWGQHIFGKEKAYNYSVRKLRRLDNKAQKKEYKAAKLGMKAAKKEEKSYTKWTERGRAKAYRKSLKYKRKSAKANFKSVKTIRKAKKWVTSMNDVFGDMKLDSVSPEDVALGRQYAVKAIEDYLKNN